MTFVEIKQKMNIHGYKATLRIHKKAKAWLEKNYPTDVETAYKNCLAFYHMTEYDALETTYLDLKVGFELETELAALIFQIIEANEFIKRYPQLITDNRYSSLNAKWELIQDIYPEIYNITFQYVSKFLKDIKREDLINHFAWKEEE